MFSFRSSVILWCLIHCAAIAKSQPAADLDIFIYEASTVDPGFGQISSPDFASNFRSFKTGFRHHLSESTVWIKFRKKEESPRSLFLELSSPNLHYVDFYYPDTVSLTKMVCTKTGFLRPFQSRPVNVSPFVLPFATTGEWYFVRIRSGHFLNADVNVLTEAEVRERSSHRIVFYSVYAGIMLIIVAAALLFIHHGRNYHYLFYVGYVLFISTINLTEKGFYFQFVWPGAPVFNFYFPLLPFGVSLCLLLFLKKTFHVDQSSKVLYWFNLWIVTILSLAVTAVYLGKGDYLSAFFMAEVHGVVSCLFIFIMNVTALVRLAEYRPFLKLIVIGLVFFCAGVIIYLLSQNDFLPHNFFTENIIVLGTAIEVCFFTASVSFYQNSLSKKYAELITLQNERLQEGIIERTKALQQKNEDLIRSLEEKENLTNIVVHDLRSPLNQTKALSNLLSVVTRGNPDVQELLERMHRANDHGLKLIEELNAIAALESDHSQVPFERINVNERLNPVLQNFATLAEKKSIALQVHESGNCLISTHPPYLIRIIENLLSNAVKFSARGSTVQFVIRRRDTWEILVCDRGPGFSEEDRKKAFRKFQRLSAAPTAGEHSTGLGLYIVKMLVERIKAEVHLTSEPGQGSSFQIKFRE